MRDWPGTPAPARAGDHRSLPPKLAAVFDFLRGIHNHTPALDELAAVSRVSKSPLFRHHLRATPRPSLRQRLLGRAEQLLRPGGLRLKEAPFNVGLADALYFSRWFKQRTGLNPSPTAFSTAPRRSDASPVRGHCPKLAQFRLVRKRKGGTRNMTFSI